MSFQPFQVSQKNDHFQVGPTSVKTKVAQEVNINLFITL